MSEEYEFDEFEVSRDIELDDIEGKDPARAKFIKGYLKATI